MAFKQFDLPVLGQITVYKRRGTKNIRLSIRHDRSIRITIPTWMPYLTGAEFARSRADWIIQHKPAASDGLKHGQAIGKAHHLYFKASLDADKAFSRLRTSQIIINYPIDSDPSSESVQKVASSAAIRALRQESEQLLPQRLRALAQTHGYDFRSVSVRQLTGRWGSCDSEKNITLNLFLMQLPWELIDYVLLHELTHTVVMKHGADFWKAMGQADSATPTHRAAIKNYKPVF